ncbi:hypothetical protein AAXE64_07495 [Priestia megaterium]
MKKDILGDVFENRFGEKFKAVEKIKGAPRYKVVFLETGYEFIAYKHNIKNGAVVDKSKKDALCKYKIGQTITNEINQKVTILDVKVEPRKSDPNKTRNFIKIIFESGYEVWCNPDTFMRGTIKDYLSPSVSGVGCLGYVENIKGRLRDMKEYRIWEGMILRCSDSYHLSGRHKSYEGVTCCERWKRFDYFLEDVVNLEGYDLWKEFHKNNPNIKNVYELDKDTIILDNKIYSPETCRFIHKSLNAAFTNYASDKTKEKVLKQLELGGINIEETFDDKYLN